MSKSYRTERFIPIGTSRRSYLDPSWEIEPWNVRNEWPLYHSSLYRNPMSSQISPMSSPMTSAMSTPMRVLDSHFHDLQSEMEQRMADMRSQMFTLVPSESFNRPAIEGSIKTKFDEPNVIEKDGKNVMELRFDVQQFRPEDINIKTKDNVLEVHAKHEDTKDNAKVFREFRRQITLPTGTILEDMTSVLSPEGILTVEAPMPIKAIEEAVLPKQAQSLQIKHE